VLLFFVWALSLSAQPVTDFPADAAIPRCVAGIDHEIHVYEGFTLCYRESYEQAEWVAYELTRDKLIKQADRSNDFRPDPAITTGSALHTDYRGSGYDRGHLAPAADMSWSDSAMSESFFMSNMSPQTPTLNRGVWSHMEEAGRRAVQKYGAVLIVSGPVLDREDFPIIGQHNNIAVPEYFYKVFAAYTGDSGAPALHTIGFIIENGKVKGDYHAFAVSVDAVEARTGLDFFSAFDDDIEEAAESVFDTELW
jgi:endonuclease G